jgi:hypothetical protein
MIFVTGDLHGVIDYDKLNKLNTEGLTKKDYLIICGDFGGVWDKGKNDKFIQSFLNKQPYTTLFVDGNHERMPEINKYPIHLWNGGKIHKISKSIYHLMRGQIFTIENKKFFTMGGAYSIDRKYRVKNVSWWEDELPNQKEYDEAILNLNNNNWKVDYVLTHTTTTNLIHLFGFIPQDEKLNTFFDDLESRLNYKHWYFGHFHMDKRIDDKHTVLYDRIIEL